jgi:hypothetical protein
MTRSLHLAIIALFMGAGVVFAAPAVTTHDSLPRSIADRSEPAAKRPEFVLHVDSKSRCVWRVSTVDGKREGGRLPCARETKQVSSRKIAATRQ